MLSSRCSRLCRWTPFTCTVCLLALSCGPEPPRAERAPSEKVLPRGTIPEAGVGTQRPDLDLLRHLESRSTLVVVGRIASEREGRGRFPGSEDPEPMRILDVEVGTSIRGEAPTRVEVLDPPERERFGAGARVLFYLSEVDGRWFNEGGFAVRDGAHVPELGLSLERIRKLHGKDER